MVKVYRRNTSRIKERKDDRRPRVEESEKNILTNKTSESEEAKL